ncbi:MAG: hypothetical protein JXB50_03520 [Spirochaetes bacterium]|nr:hypothetical protein [Spirochaetota bacterium]
MNKYIFLLIILFVSSLTFSQDILNDNEYYKKAVEFLEKAKEEFEKGDYDAGYKFSQEAKDNIGKANEYFLIQITVLKIDSKKSDIKKLEDEINKEGINESNSRYNEFNSIKKTLEEAEGYYNQADLKEKLIEKSELYQLSFEKYSECENKLNNILSYLKSGIELKKETIEKKSEPEEIIETKIEIVEKTVIPDQRYEAMELLEIAKKELIKEIRNKAEKYYNNEIKKVKEYINSSSDNFENEKYVESISLSKQAIEIMNTFDYKKLAFEIFPRYYKVQDYSKTQDCLWKIAEENFVYNDPLKWTVLYEANKKRLINPENPDMILKWKLIEIPSLNGEIREGIYNPNKKYPVFDPSINYSDEN